MIDFAKVRITSKEDYEQLLDIIDETHIDEEVVSLTDRLIRTFRFQTKI